MKLSLSKMICACALISFGQAGFTQAVYPAKPVTMVVPFAPGGTADNIGRLLANHMSQTLGQAVAVENRAGAGGNIGSAYVAKSAAPDGYTILLATNSLATNVSLMKMSFDPRRDLAAVAGIAGLPNVMIVSKDSPYKSLADVVAAGKAKPQSLSYGSSGPGSGSHLASELFRAASGTPMLHVPYKGSAAVYPDLLSGRISFLFDVFGSAAPMIEGGSVRALAISSRQRLLSFPNIPTVQESGYPGFVILNWIGFFAPVHTPAPVIAKLQAAVERALAQPDVKAALSKIGAESVPVKSAEFGAYFNADVERWAGLVREGRVKPLE